MVLVKRKSMKFVSPLRKKTLSAPSLGNRLASCTVQVRCKDQLFNVILSPSTLVANAKIQILQE